VKIILINYRYFVSGGPERYLFNIKEVLEKNGHTVVPFSIKNQNNSFTEYEKYFMKPVSDDEAVYFSEYNKFNPLTTFRSFLRLFYSFEAKKKLNRLIRIVKPDIIYVLHYQNKISPSIFDAAKKNNIPVVHRISDFGLICSNALFYRPIQKDICERCLTGSRMNAVINKCVHNSRVYSFVKASSLKFQQTLKLKEKIQAFVVPSMFTIEKLKAYGLPSAKIVHVPTFFNFQSISATSEISYEPFALYIGRIEPEKGLLTLVKSFEDTGFHLKIIGFSNSGFDDELKNYLKGKAANVEFLGRKSFEEIQGYLSKCAFTIVPSEWYDNFPNSILESFAFRKCVIATNIGSLKEMVLDGETGLLFRIKDHKDLCEKISFLFNNVAECQRLGLNAFARLNTEYSEKEHYTRLIKIFSSVIEVYNTRNISLQPT
jgi:glycosyltransferase involved in cell wall biosynthesis